MMRHWLECVFWSQNGELIQMCPDSYCACWSEQNNFSHLQVSAYTHCEPLHHAQGLVERHIYLIQSRFGLESEKTRVKNQFDAGSWRGVLLTKSECVFDVFYIGLDKRSPFLICQAVFSVGCGWKESSQSSNAVIQ